MVRMGSPVSLADEGIMDTRPRAGNLIVAGGILVA